VPDVPPDYHLAQMAGYVAALRVIFPGRPVEASLLYTAGPVLVTLTEAELATHKPRYPATEQS
jgi:ATP-dependent helicase/nuclease subunit A